MNIVWAGADKPELNEVLAAWAASIIGLRNGFQRPFTTMGVFQGDKIIATIVFNNYSREAGVIEIHGASVTPRWLTKPVLWAMFSYPFQGIGCQSVVMRVDPDDTRLMRILTSYGFDHFRLPRLRGRDKDEMVYILHDDEWRKNGFHKENN